MWNIFFLVLDLAVVEKHPFMLQQGTFWESGVITQSKGSLPLVDIRGYPRR